MENFSKDQINQAMDAIPYEVQKLLFSTTLEQKIQKIGTSAGLLIEQLKVLINLTNFAIMKLIPRKEFSFVVEKELSIPEGEARELSNNISLEIFAPVEAMESQAKKEELLYENDKNSEKENIEKSSIVTSSQSNVSRMPDVAPENLPTDEEGESLLPPIPLKFGAEGVSAPAHPFEEKMKKVFTAGQQSLGDLAIEPPSQTSSPTQVPKAPPIFHADPYREPIE